MINAFGTYHPLVNFTFFFGAIGFGMFINHPFFIAVSYLCSICLYFLLTRNSSKKFIFISIILIVSISFFNAVMNPMGNTVLFVWILNRNFTLESLIYGAFIGLNCSSIMLWFSCYNAIMTNDKFMYLFSKFAPSITLVLSMTLRIVPKLENKTKTIINARNCIGKTIDNNSYKEKIKNGTEVLSILTSCALEDAVITADSMRSRGYVSKGRTNYIVYNRTIRDKILNIIFILLVLLIMPCALKGGMSIQYIPQIIFPKIDIFTIIALISYFIFLFIPIAIEISEDIIWHILKSKI